MDLETTLFPLKLIFIVIAYNMLLSVLLGTLFTAPYMRKQLKHINDPSMGDGVWFLRRISTAIGYSVYIVKDIPKEGSMTEEIYGKGFSFRKYARPFDIYVAYGLVLGFLIALGLGTFIKLLEYFFL